MRPANADARETVSSAAGSLLFLLIAPGVVAGLIPWWLTGWHLRPGALDSPVPKVVGAALVAVATGALLHAFARFVLEGRGTPAPVAPTEQLVVGGLYRFVRNPMYLAVAATIVGQALLLDQLSLLAYAGAFAATVGLFVHYYEEPTLLEQFGIDYEEYRHNVRAWIPRLRPWVPDADRPTVRR